MECFPVLETDFYCNTSYAGAVADNMGLGPAYTIHKTGLVLADRSNHLLDDAQFAAWDEAIEEYKQLASAAAVTFCCELLLVRLADAVAVAAVV